VSSKGQSPKELDNLRGLALMLSGDVAGAMPLFERALPLPEARFNRAVALLKLAKYPEAAKDFAAIYADESSPLRASAAYHEALALDGLHRDADAAAWLERALAADPQLDSALLYLGVMRERLGDLQAAGKAYKQFLDRHPDSVVAMLRFGVAAQAAGREDTARKYFERVVAAAPDSPEAAEARMYLVMWGD
jgi:tetratricopeptide (TPR) repeat protein